MKLFSWLFKNKPQRFVNIVCRKTEQGHVVSHGLFIENFPWDFNENIICGSCHQTFKIGLPSDSTTMYPSSYSVEIVKERLER